MEYLNKTFKNRITGEIFQIIDVYQNVAITSNKEKINTNMLENDKFFTQVANPPKAINESFKPMKDDSVDPNKFFSNQSIYNAFADQIKKVPLEKVPMDSESINNNVNMPSSYGDLPVSTNESAIIMSDPEDEIEELKRKYGAISVDQSIQRQNDVFAKILEEPTDQDNESVQRVEVSRNDDYKPQQNYINQMSNEERQFNQPVHRVEVVDPVTQMFKNVKRNTNFNLSFKITGQIPRLDFIEMMEDSYEVSIIEYLADEFTQNILKDPQVIRNKVISEIKSMIEKNSNKSVTQIESTPVEEKKPKTTRTSSRKKNVSE